MNPSVQEKIHRVKAKALQKGRRCIKICIYFYFAVIENVRSKCGNSGAPAIVSGSTETGHMSMYLSNLNRSH